MDSRRITRGWPPERRKEQAIRCRKARPSRHATGPKTAAGKSTCANNAYKHGLRSAEMEEIDHLLARQKAILKSAGESDFRSHASKIVPNKCEARECAKTRPKAVKKRDLSTHDAKLTQ